MTSASGGLDIPLDDAGKLLDDVGCRTCGYNLRGLPTDGRCPECGSSVGWSIHGDLLQYSDPAWVRHQADGMLWLIVAIFLGIGLGIGGTVFDSMLENELPSVFASVIASIVGVVGYWKVTMPDPGKRGATASLTLTRATRWLAVAGVFSGPAGLGANLSTSSSSAIAVVSVVAAALLSLAGVVAGLLLFILMRRLALRIPDLRLASQTRVVMWGIVSCYGAMVIGGLIVALVAVSAFATGAMSGGGGGGGGAGLAGLGIAVMVVGCAIVAALIGFAIWFVVLLFLYRRALNRAADTALRTWMRYGADGADPAGGDDRAGGEAPSSPPAPA